MSNLHGVIAMQGHAHSRLIQFLGAVSRSEQRLTLRAGPRRRPMPPVLGLLAGSGTTSSSSAAPVPLSLVRAACAALAWRSAASRRQAQVARPLRGEHGGGLAVRRVTVAVADRLGLRGRRGGGAICRCPVLSGDQPLQQWMRLGRCP